MTYLFFGFRQCIKLRSGLGTHVHAAQVLKIPGVDALLVKHDKRSTRAFDLARILDLCMFNGGFSVCCEKGQPSSGNVGGLDLQWSMRVHPFTVGSGALLVRLLELTG